MDPRLNPYSPGAGTIPPELAGRDEIVETVSIALDRCRGGLSFRGFLFVGLRGVGKTVLLTKLSQVAEAQGFVVVSVEAPEQRSLPALLIPVLRTALLRLSRFQNVAETTKRVMRVLGSFLNAMKISYQDVEFGLDLGKEDGIADTGDLENDLCALFVELGKAAREAKTGFVLFIDEIQYLEETQFSALISALHKCTQLQLPFILVGAGLPQLVGQAGKAKSYAERLFVYPEVGPLSDSAAREALEAPAARYNVFYTQNALDEILRCTQRYPYFLQEWGKHSWAFATSSPITYEDVCSATEFAIAELDESFFRVRYDRLTPYEKKYVRAMAELGEGLHRSGDIANLLGRDISGVAPCRAALIRKGMIYSPAHGDTAFTVPLFEGFIKRMLPDFDAVIGG